jgi:uncharacterized surface protein with fasciclin (FAS1) repeats
MTTMLLSMLILVFATHTAFIDAFQSPLTPLYPRRVTASTRLHATDTSQLETLLQARYPQFMRLLLGKNDGVWKKLRDGSGNGLTIFAPNAQAFDTIGDKRIKQLEDPRNSETAEKMGAYHAIAERVTADQLFASGGIITLGGTVPVGRSTTGGIFGFGGKEDGGVTVGGAKVVESYEEETSRCIIHEVDAFVSPEILWRYCDQLRIPGSK